ncbi:PREDICTED: dihydroorotate dehydrogenase (quinone), mitochondrial [Nicrophorus vespilloides]|uniref:Dihydroorotate dehydrogenase (quinone), mitochondrial n=1 Tax=Nicrophorus vespilloides TaxID=110193 RepID=A0ABM1NFS5_NICVS|nr:PREDICTED: dihydroorotate dehydrogenase (quinone), mitochondrial [Nicrophorus vespilloides]
MSLKHKLKSLVVVSMGGIATFAAINVYKQDEHFYKHYIMPVVHLLDPESAHRLGIVVSKYRLLPKANYTDPKQLNVTVFGKTFSNPIGIAAGFDKHAEAVLGLQDMGFGLVEIGSVTPQPQEGNAKPRVFRLNEDYAVINRYGFNSDGHEVVYNRLNKLRSEAKFDGVLGINLGKNKESQSAVNDYVAGIEKFGSLADYLVINISSPNTVGLRNLQGKEQLRDLLKNVLEARNKLQDPKPPLLLKVAPDLSTQERKDVAEVIKSKGCKVDGLIVSNTTIHGRSALENKSRDETGGLSGRPVKEVSTEMIAEMYKLTNGLPIIGVGGVSCGQDAYEKIKAGASIVQIYTTLVFDGPPVVTKIKRELAELLERDNYKSISEAVGVDAK